MSDRIVVITGGYGRLGRSLARTFVGAGDRVVLTGRDGTRLRQAAEELQVADAQELDVSDGKQIADLVAHCQERYGRIDVLINNAALMRPAGPIDEIDPDQVLRMLQVNIHGPFLCIRAFLPLLEGSGTGLVINIASTSGHRADAGSAPYNAAKFGLLGLTEALRKELRSRDVRVSSISPSAIRFEDEPAAGGKGVGLQGMDVAETARWLADLPPRALVRDVELWAGNP